MLVYLSIPQITRIMDKQPERERERAREKYFYITTMSFATTNASLAEWYRRNRKCRTFLTVLRSDVLSSPDCISKMIGG